MNDLYIYFSYIKQLSNIEQTRHKQYPGPAHVWPSYHNQPGLGPTSLSIVCCHDRPLTNLPAFSCGSYSLDSAQQPKWSFYVSSPSSSKLSLRGENKRTTACNKTVLTCSGLLPHYVQISFPAILPPTTAWLGPKTASGVRAWYFHCLEGTFLFPLALCSIVSISEAFPDPVEWNSIPHLCTTLLCSPLSCFTFYHSTYVTTSHIYIINSIMVCLPLIII